MNRIKCGCGYYIAFELTSPSSGVYWLKAFHQGYVWPLCTIPSGDTDASILQFSQFIIRGLYGSMVNEGLSCADRTWEAAVKIMEEL